MVNFKRLVFIGGLFATIGLSFDSQANTRYLDLGIKAGNAIVAGMVLRIGYLLYQQNSQMKEVSQFNHEAGTVLDHFEKGGFQHVLVNARLSEITRAGKCSQVPCGLEYAQMDQWGPSLKGKDLSNVIGLEKANYKKCSNWRPFEYDKAKLNNRQIADKLSAGYTICE